MKYFDVKVDFDLFIINKHQVFTHYDTLANHLGLSKWVCGKTDIADGMKVRAKRLFKDTVFDTVDILVVVEHEDIEYLMEAKGLSFGGRIPISLKDLLTYIPDLKFKKDEIVLVRDNVYILNHYDVPDSIKSKYEISEFLNRNLDPAKVVDLCFIDNRLYYILNDVYDDESLSELHFVIQEHGIMLKSDYQKEKSRLMDLFVRAMAAQFNIDYEKCDTVTKAYAVITAANYVESIGDIK